MEKEENKYDARLKSKIESALRSTGDPHIEDLLQYMEKNDYYTCKSSSHNHWEGGAAEHMWATFVMAKALRDQQLSDPDTKKYATDEKLAIVCLLHDLCDMPAKVKTSKGEDISSKHGRKSYWIMRNFKVGTIAEQEAVKNHMHSDVRTTFKDVQQGKEYEVLHKLIRNADHLASGTAWNSLRHMNQETQRHGSKQKDYSYLNAVALDRTSQCCGFKMYMDGDYDVHELTDYNRNNIQWGFKENLTACLLNNELPHLDWANRYDVISAARNLKTQFAERLCLVIGVSDKIPSDGNTRLQQDFPDEQEILICSNLLRSLYQSGKDHTKGSKRHRMQFSMRDEIKFRYEDKNSLKKGIFFPFVTMIRSGKSEGCPLVKPWTVDVLFAPGVEFKPFITFTKNIIEQL